MVTFVIQRSVVGSRDLSNHFRLELQFQLDSYLFLFLTLHIAHQLVTSHSKFESCTRPLPELARIVLFGISPGVKGEDCLASTLLSYSKGRFVLPGDSEKVSSVEAFHKEFRIVRSVTRKTRKLALFG